jgi:hypothetical protein|tara:strand:- start:1278 stop:1856 length:579 start_codon:yes stop_codon:yes gene_type:complete
MKNITKLLSTLGLTLAFAVGTVCGQVPTDHKRGPKKGLGKGKPSKERVEAAKKKRSSKRKIMKGIPDAKKDHTVRGKRGGRGSFGNLFKEDEKLAKLRKDFEAATKEIRTKSKDLFTKYKAAEEDGAKATLRESLKAIRGEQAEAAKKHRVEITARLKELGVEFKNPRTNILNNERRGDRSRRGKGNKPGIK